MRNSKRIKIVAGGTAALFGIGVAFAAWTSTGTGTGTVDSISDVGLLVDGNDVGGLFPSGEQTITVSVTNNNPYNVALDNILVGTITSTDSSCDVSSVRVDSNNAPNRTVAKNGGLEQFSFVVTMDANADNDCQGDEFTVPFTANGHSVG